MYDVDATFPDPHGACAGQPVVGDRPAARRVAVSSSAMDEAFSVSAIARDDVCEVAHVHRLRRGRRDSSSGGCDRVCALGWSSTLTAFTCVARVAEEQLCQAPTRQAQVRQMRLLKAQRCRAHLWPRTTRGMAND